MAEPTLVLSHLQVNQRINRIAYELYESNFEEEKIILVGIANRGYILAKRLQAVLATICELKVELVELKMHKDLPLEHPINMSIEGSAINEQAVVLVDDVLNTGRTLIYAVNHLLMSTPKRLSTVVLVNRRHRRFPIRADFAGLTLSTTLQEHIDVELSNDIDAVYLH
jgi:pyrimidine operon attenuation protein/uracil phosphoribosyltransferase